VGLSRELREMDDLEAEHAQHEWGAALLGVSRHVLAADRIVFAFSLPAASFRTAVRQVRLLPPPARPLQHHLSARRTLRRCGGVATLDIYRSFSRLLKIKAKGRAKLRVGKYTTLVLSGFTEP
jgi:hypothetical protein